MTDNIYWFISYHNGHDYQNTVTTQHPMDWFAYKLRTHAANIRMGYSYRIVFYTEITEQQYSNISKFIP